MANVILTGNTYKAKDIIKKFASAKFCSHRKVWTMSKEGFDEMKKSYPSTTAGINAVADVDNTTY